MDTINLKKDQTEKYLEFIYNFGSVCMLNQLTELEAKINNIKKNSAQKKVKRVLTKLEKNNFIGVETINRYKVVYLKRNAHMFLSGSNTRYKNISKSRLLNEGYLRNSIYSIEYYLKTNISNIQNNLNNQLLNITSAIYKSEKQFGKGEFPYDKHLLKKILDDKGISGCNKEINNLEDSNIVKILWTDIYNLFCELNKKRQTISAKPLYFKMFKQNNNIYIHYVPEIVLNDLHDLKYYKGKLKNLQNSFFKIEDNYVLNMRKKFEVNNDLGPHWKNIIGFSIKLIGIDEDELELKKETIEKYDKNNLYSCFIGNCEYESINAYKYFSTAISNQETIDSIDSKLDKLIQKQIKNLSI